MLFLLCIVWTCGDGFKFVFFFQIIKVPESPGALGLRPPTSNDVWLKVMARLVSLYPYTKSLYKKCAHCDVN